MLKKIAATAAAALAIVAGTTTAAANPAGPAFNPRNVEWPGGYRQLPAQKPYATFANQQDTVRCGVYNVNGQDFIHCISLVDRMPGHQCNERYGQANAMNLGKWDAWDCADKNAFAGAPKMGNLQLRYYGSTFAATDHKGNVFIGDRGLNRVLRVGEINDIYADRGTILAFNSRLRGSSIPAGSSL